MGPVTLGRLIERFGSARGVVEDSDAGSLDEVRGMTRAMAEKVLRAGRVLDRAERTADALRRRGVHIVRITDADYPAALLDLAVPPPLLTLFGEVTSCEPAVSMVGTTKPSQRGRKIAEEFAARFARAGVTVVSGYAHGIDAASHRGAFNAGGRSILCVPYGIMHFRSRPDFPPLPEIASRGAVVSECPPEREWSAAAAISRNRIIAALGKATFVIEARTRGGTMHTVKAAEQLGRPVFALKYGRPHDSARGNSIIIARGASEVNTFGEVKKILTSVGRDRGGRGQSDSAG